MQAKSFFISSIIVIAIVAIVTSYITVLYLVKPVLLSGQQGTITLGLGSGTVQVIVVDNSVTTGISDTVNFSGVVRGTPGNPATYRTDLITSTLTTPWPFLLRNIGSEIARVQIYYDGGSCLEPIAGTLFCATGSYVKFWVEQAACEPGTTTSGWGCLWAGGTPVINCGADGCFTTATTCSDYSGSCNSEANAKDLPFTNTNRKYAIQDLKPSATGKNEAIVHIKIGVDALEPSGVKSAIFRIIATQGP